VTSKSSGCTGSESTQRLLVADFGFFAEGPMADGVGMRLLVNDSISEDDAIRVKPGVEHCKFCGAPDVRWRYQIQRAHAPSLVVERWAMCDVCHRHLGHWLKAFQR
jgi:hypothetical protein